MMLTRRAACGCGQLRIETRGDPVRLSVCHCFACQTRTGSAFGFQARFPLASVSFEGTATKYTRIADSGNEVTFNFCPHCGTTLFWTLSGYPDVIAIAAGAFTDPGFPSPKVSVYEVSRHAWVVIDAAVEHFD